MRVERKKVANNKKYEKEILDEKNIPSDPNLMKYSKTFSLTITTTIRVN